MSKKLDASIKCPNCGHEQKMSLFRSIWAEYDENRILILEDKINLFRCGKCKHEERLEFPFLCTNTEKGVAIWYEPYHDPQIDEDAESYSKHMGKDSFYAKAPRIADWETFKAKFLEMDAAGPQHGQEVKRSKETQDNFNGFVNALKKDEISRAGGQSSSSNTRAGDFPRLLKEAESGDKDAQYVVGGAYLNGNGVKRDPFRGERWLLAAAEQGQAAAQCDLGALYTDGRILKQSYSNALKWLSKAAEQGDALAMANLGSLYGKGFRDNGIGFFQRVRLANMSVDRVEAYKWFSLALQGGRTTAERDLGLLKRLMSADQIEAAERKIEEFARERRRGRGFSD